jgi:hypothetical protein
MPEALSFAESPRQQGLVSDAYKVDILDLIVQRTGLVEIVKATHITPYYTVHL